MSMFMIGKQCNGLIDSGADVSLISSTFLDDLSQLTSVKLDATTETIRVLGGGTVKVRARCTMPLKIGNLETKHEFCVVPMTASCLLGGDFLERHNCIVDYKNRVLTVDDEKVPMKSVDKEETHQVLRVILEQNVKLKPYTEVVVYAKVEGVGDEAGLQIVGPTHESCETGGVLVGKTLANVKDGHVPVRLVNLSPGRKKFRKTTKLQYVNHVKK